MLNKALISDDFSNLSGKNYGHFCLLKATVHG